MRSTLNLIAGLSLFALVACSSNNPPSTVSPGAVGASDSTGQTCPATCEQSASPGAVSDTSGCPYSGKSTTDASLGVVGDDAAKSGCCSSKSETTGTSLGVVGDDAAKSGCCSSKGDAAGTSLGVVGDDAAKSGCCSSKSDAAGTSLGVVGDAKSCPSSKPATGGDCTRSGQSL